MIYTLAALEVFPDKHYLNPFFYFFHKITFGCKTLQLGRSSCLPSAIKCGVFTERQKLNMGFRVEFSAFFY